MDAHNKILAAIAGRACERISRAVIGTFQKMTEGMHSGSDSGLKNIWDEICVQVQGQESALWEAYVDTVKDVIAQYLAKVNRETREAIWLQTDNGSEWEPHEDEAIPAEDGDTTEYILRDYVLSAASNWTNHRIQKFVAKSLEID